MVCRGFGKSVSCNKNKEGQFIILENIAKQLDVTDELF